MGDAALAGGGGDGTSDARRNVLVEHAGDNVLLAQLFGRDTTRNCLGGGQLHRFVDVAGTHIQRATEDARECQHVVDLVGIITAPRGDDPRVSFRLFRHDLGHGIGQRKHDGILRHLLQRLEREHTRPAHADEQVRATGGVFDRTADVARVGVLGEPSLAEIEFAKAATADDTLPVTTDDGTRPRSLKHFGHGDAGSARADNENFDFAELPMGQFHRIERRGEHYHGGAVLVVVKHGDVQFLLEARFDLETTRRADVLEVDGAEPGGYPFHRADDLVDFLGPEANWVSIDVGEFLEQHRFAFHDRHRGFGADVPKAKHRGAIANDSDGVVFDGQRICFAFVFGDGQADTRHAGCVRH